MNIKSKALKKAKIFLTEYDQEFAVFCCSSEQGMHTSGKQTEMQIKKFVSINFNGQINFWAFLSSKNYNTIKHLDIEF